MATPVETRPPAGLEAAAADAETAVEVKVTPEIRTRAARAGEPEWLTELRAAGLAAWEQLELPHRAQHLWRYTDPAILLPAAGAPGESADSAPPFRLEVTLDDAARRAGVQVLDLLEAVRTHGPLVQRVLGQVVAPAFGKFEAHNAAEFTGGVFVHVPRGVRLEEPIRLVRTHGDGPRAYTRLAVLVEDGAEVTLIDEMTGGPVDSTRQVREVTEIQVGDRARVHFVTIEELSRRTQALVTQRFRVGRNALMVPVLALFGGALVKTDIGARLEGEGAESEMTGFLAAVGRQKFDHHTLHHHLGRHTRSNLDYKTVLKGRARSAYTGLIRVEGEAQFSQAYQENRNLLLSESCRADSIPELEILTEEVQCTHGATVGPLDREHLFYLQSRAIPEDQAVRMIIEGHFESALKKLPDGLQERLRVVLRERLA